VSPTDSTIGEQTVWHALFRTMPPKRLLRDRPSVSEVVAVPRVDGGVAMSPPSSILGRVDGITSTPYYWKSLFPPSQPHYPLDSIARVQRERADAWVNRLNALTGSAREYAIGAWKTVPLAELAVAAGNDSMARRLFDARVAALSAAPAERSFVLFKAVATFANPTQDSMRLTRNLMVAEAYLKRLHAIPAGKYATRHDSLVVVARPWRAEDTLITAYAAARNTAQALEHTRHMLSYVTILGAYDRTPVVEQGLARVVEMFRHTRDDRVQLAAFEPTILAAARRAETDVPTGTPDGAVRALHGFASRVQDEIDSYHQWFALLDRPAPAIAAHAWLNTPDSLYDSIPRKRTFDDGRVHAIMFLRGLEDQTRPGVLSRIQQEFGKDVDVLLVLNTEGYAGPDIVEPRVEVAWLTRYLVGRRHLTIPMAIWAGSKVPDGFVPEGRYAVRRPTPEPNSAPYYQRYWGTGCALIDRQGRIRYFQNAARRTDEVMLRRRLRELIAEPAAGVSQ